MVRGESVSRGRVSRERDGDERGRELSPSNAGHVRSHSTFSISCCASSSLVLHYLKQVTHTGRGGAGNIRSPSREPGAIREELLHERQLIDASKDPNEAVTFVSIVPPPSSIYEFRARLRPTLSDFPIHYPRLTFRHRPLFPIESILSLDTFRHCLSPTTLWLSDNPPLSLAISVLRDDGECFTLAAPATNSLPEEAALVCSVPLFSFSRAFAYWYFVLITLTKSLKSIR